MLERVVGVLAMGVLLCFLGVLVVFVREPALIVVIAIVVLMGGADFYFTLFRGRKGGSGF